MVERGDKDYLGMFPVKELQATMKYQKWEGYKEDGCGKDQADTGRLNGQRGLRRERSF